MSIEDKLYKLLPLYKILPDWVKMSIAIPFKILPREFYLGKNYRIIKEEAKQLEFASEDKIQQYQWEKLKEVLEHSYNTVPYYNSKWNELGINIKEIQNFNDFEKKIPFLSKSEIQQNPSSFLSSKYSKNVQLKVNSGGSTGKPIELYQLKGYSRAAEWAHMHLQWSRIGFKPTARMARLRGDYLGKNKIYSFDPWRNMLLLSSFGVSKNTAKNYLQLLKKYRINYINAYPASIYNLIQCSELSNFKIPTLKSVFLGSENMLEYQIERIKEFFKIKDVFYWYGHGEICALGGMCEDSTNYHFFPSYGYTEFIKNEKLGEINSENIVEIVGTSFINPAMPLIRYRTEDYGIENKELCRCGRKHKLLSKVIGREQEIAIGFNNEKITLTALIFGRHGKYFDHVIKMQLINTKPGELIVKVIPKESFSDKHIQLIKNNLSEKEGMPFNTKVEVVKKIDTTLRGKHRLLIRNFEL